VSNIDESMGTVALHRKPCIGDNF